MDMLGAAAQKYKSKVVAPRNPKRLKGEQLQFKVSNNIQYLNVTYIIVLFCVAFFQVHVFSEITAVV